MPRIERKSITQNFDISTIDPFENTGSASSGAVVVQKSVELIDQPNKEPGTVNFGSAAEVGTMQNIEPGTKVILLGRQSAEAGNAASHQDRFFYLNKKYSGNPKITVSITAICGDNTTDPAVIRQGGSVLELSTPENASGDILELQHSVDGDTWTTFRNVRPHDAGNGVRDLTFSEFRTVTTTFTPPDGQSVYIRVNQKNYHGNTHDHYAVKSLVVDESGGNRSTYGGGNRMASGFTTLNPKIVQIIHDNSESDSYVAQNLSIKNRRNISKSIRNSSFDDQKELRPPNTTRKEVISISVKSARGLIDRCKIFIRGADGIEMKSYAFVSSDRDDIESFEGGLTAADTKINILTELRKIPFKLRKKRASIARAIASSLAQAIEADKSLKIKARSSDNKVYLEDHYVESAVPHPVRYISGISPPRAIQHPAKAIRYARGTHTNLANTEEGKTITIVDAQGLKRVYALVNSSQTSMTTGTVINTGDDIGSGTASSGLKGAIAVAVNISSTLSSTTLKELKVAINHKNGHGRRISVSDVYETITYGYMQIRSAVPPLREGQGIQVSENTASFTLVDTIRDETSMGPPTASITFSSLPAVNSYIEIRPRDNVLKRYVSCRSDGDVNTGDTLKSGDIVDGPGTAVGAAGIGGVAVVANDRSNFEEQFVKAINSKNGQRGKVKIRKVVPLAGANEYVLTDKTSSKYSFDTWGTQSVTSTAGGAATVSTWKGASGGKIVEAIQGDEKSVSSIKVEIVSYGGPTPDIIAGINYTNIDVAKEAGVNDHKAPDIQFRSPVLHGSGPNKNIFNPTTGSFNPFKEVGLYESFDGETGPGVNLEHTYVARQNEASLTSALGKGFEGSLSSKECIEIELDGSGATTATIYRSGNGAGDNLRPSMAYLSKTGVWTPLTHDPPCDTRFPGAQSSQFPNPLAAISALYHQISERAMIGFSQNYSMLISRLENSTYIERSSLGMSEETFESEKERFAFVEGAPSSCINTFGFPSHPKFSRDDSLKFDMSDYIDDDFLVENIVVDCQLAMSGGTVTKTNLNYLGDFAELMPEGLTFFMLCERKGKITDQASEIAFQMEIDEDLNGDVNNVSRITNASSFSIPAWYPYGKSLAWPASFDPGSSEFIPNSTIYNGESAATINAGVAASRGWSFYDVMGNSGVWDTPIVSGDRWLQCRWQYISTSNIDKINPVSQIDSLYTANSHKPHINIPLSEGYSENSYLTTDYGYRLRFQAYVAFEDANGDSIPDILQDIGDFGPGGAAAFQRGYWRRFNRVNVFATYLDSVKSGKSDGIRNLVASVDIEDHFSGSPIPLIYDVPIRTEFASNSANARKFNLMIEVITSNAVMEPSSSDINESIYISNLEISRTEKSQYVDTIRDIVGWGNIATFPEDYNEIQKNLSSKSIDIRERFSTVIDSDIPVTGRYVTRFPALAPVPGDVGTISAYSSVGASPYDLIVTNWDSLGRSGIAGMPSNRSVVRSLPGNKPAYTTRQFRTKYRVPIARHNSQVSPYLLKKSDKIIIGAQAPMSYFISESSTTAGATDLLQGKVRVKIYGSRVLNERLTHNNQKDSLNTDSVHQVIGDIPVRDQIEAYSRSDLSDTYMDKIMFGDPSLTKFARGAELVDIGIGKSYNVSNIYANTIMFKAYMDGIIAERYVPVKSKPIGTKNRDGFGKYGDFLPMCATIVVEKGTDWNAASQANSWTGKWIQVTDHRYQKVRRFIFQTTGTTGTTFVSSGGFTYVRVVTSAAANIRSKIQELRKAILQPLAFGQAGADANAILDNALKPESPLAVHDNFFALALLDLTDSNSDLIPDSGHYVAALQIFPRIFSRAEADLYDKSMGPHGEGTNSLIEISLAGGGWTDEMSVRLLPAFGQLSSTHHVARPVQGLSTPWNMLRKDRVFNRGVVTKPSEGTSGITGSLQHFATLVDSEVVKYDSLVPPVYEFLKNFDVKVPVSGDSGVGGFISGSFLPIFQRCQVINTSGSACTGRGAFPHSTPYVQAPGIIGFDKNITNLWSRWVNERGVMAKTTDPLNPETFRVDSATFSTSLGNFVTHPNDFKEATPIARVQVPDMNRFGAQVFVSRTTRAGDNIATSAHPCHYTGSLTGFGRRTGDEKGNQAPPWGVVQSEKLTSGSQLSVIGGTSILHDPVTAIFSPLLNENVAKDTLKALYGFETSFYSRAGNQTDEKHDPSNGMVQTGIGVVPFTLKTTTVLTPQSSDVDVHGARPVKAPVVVRGMRYGLDNFLPTSNTVKVRFNRFGQFRDLLEQRLFTSETKPEDSTISNDRPVEVVYMSRPSYDELGNIRAVRKRAIPATETNSQNLSNYATSSFPYFDEWDEAVPTQYRFGRDRSSSLPDDSSVTVVTEVS